MECRYIIRTKWSKTKTKKLNPEQRLTKKH